MALAGVAAGACSAPAEDALGELTDAGANQVTSTVASSSTSAATAIAPATAITPAPAGTAGDGSGTEISAGDADGTTGSSEPGDGSGGEGQTGDWEASPLAHLIPAGTDLGPSWQRTSVAERTESELLIDPDDGDAQVCGLTDQVLLPPGLEADFGYPNTDGYAVVLAAAGSTSEIEGAYTGLVAGLGCQRLAAERDRRLAVNSELTLADAGSATVIAETGRDGTRTDWLLASYDDVLLVVGVMHPEGVDQTDLVTLAETLTSRQ
jgi:hypothetical protein